MTNVTEVQKDNKIPSVRLFSDPYKLFGQLTSRLCSTGKSTGWTSVGLL